MVSKSWLCTWSVLWLIYVSRTWPLDIVEHSSLISSDCTEKVPTYDFLLLQTHSIWICSAFDKPRGLGDSLNFIVFLDNSSFCPSAQRATQLLLPHRDRLFTTSRRKDSPHGRMVSFQPFNDITLFSVWHCGLFMNYPSSFTGGPKPTSSWWIRGLKKTCWPLWWGSLKSCSGQKISLLPNLQQI